MRWAPGRRSRSRTSRWTAPGRSTRRGSRSSAGRRTRRWSSPSAARRPGTLPETLTLQLDPYTLAPLGADAVSLAALQARALLDAGAHAPSATWPRWRCARGATPSTTPTRSCKGDFEVDEAPGRAVPGLAAAQARLPADHRRRRRDRARRGRRRAPRLPPAGLDPRHRPPHRAAPAGLPRSHGLAVHEARGGEGRRRRQRRSTSPSCTRPSRHQELILRRALGLPAGGARSTPRAARSRRTR